MTEIHWKKDAGALERTNFGDHNYTNRHHGHNYKLKKQRSKTRVVEQFALGCSAQLFQIQMRQDLGVYFYLVRPSK